MERYLHLNYPNLFIKYVVESIETLDFAVNSYLQTWTELGFISLGGFNKNLRGPITINFKVYNNLYGY